jgi:FMN-dependent NADH-azoreductase
MTLFRLDASIRREGSVSREVADTVQRSWIERHPHDTVIHRDLGVSPLPADAWSRAVSTGFVPADEQTAEQRAVQTLTARLADEVLGADALLIATPLYNYGISQHVKTWIDLAIAGSAPGTQLLAGKPALGLTTRGGGYGPGTPREGWDHATGWMRRILADVWQLDLRVVEREFTLVGVNPALDQFKEMAAQLRAESEAVARRHGAELGRSRRDLGSVSTSGGVRMPGAVQFGGLWCATAARTPIP